MFLEEDNFLQLPNSVGSFPPLCEYGELLPLVGTKLLLLLRPRLVEEYEYEAKKSDQIPLNKRIEGRYKKSLEHHLTSITVGGTFPSGYVSIDASCLVILYSLCLLLFLRCGTVSIAGTICVVIAINHR
uniref:Uncharacterized protein n=1 Tax=Glossina brevipalpis TaxID=37001 RepID=A0A1A9W6M6_9MUSC